MRRYSNACRGGGGGGGGGALGGMGVKGGGIAWAYNSGSTVRMYIFVGRFSYTVVVVARKASIDFSPGGFDEWVTTTNGFNKTTLFFIHFFLKVASPGDHPAARAPYVHRPDGEEGREYGTTTKQS